MQFIGNTRAEKCQRQKSLDWVVIADSNAKDPPNGKLGQEMLVEIRVVIESAARKRRCK